MVECVRGLVGTSEGALVFLRVLPHRTIQRAHVNALACGDLTAHLDVPHPEVECVVVGLLVEAKRPQCSHVQYRIWIGMSDVQQHRRGRPIHAMQASQHTDPQVFDLCCQSDLRDLDHFTRTVAAALRLTARTLPLAYKQEISVRELARGLGASPCFEDRRVVPICVATRPTADASWFKSKFPFRHSAPPLVAENRAT